MFSQVQVKMYAPNGAEVVWLVSVEGGPAEAMEIAAALERAGLFPTPPTEEERERRSRVGAFVVRSHINGDGSETPVVDVYFRHRNGYTDRLRSMRVYLNTPRDRKDFERAFGVRLDALNIYDGDTPIERGKRPQQERFVYAPAHDVWAVWRINPASTTDEKAPKRLFVRWETDRYPPDAPVILDAVREEAITRGVEPQEAVAAFLEAAARKPGVRVTPAQARAWVRKRLPHG